MKRAVASNFRGDEPKQTSRELEWYDDRPEVPKYDSSRLFSLDVECVATGRTHARRHRSACELALVNSIGTLLFHTYIKPSEYIVSYLTPYIGLEHGDLDRLKPISLRQALQRLKALLPKNAILVGQCPEGDVVWTGLNKGLDFVDTVDLAEIFRTSDGTLSSLRHAARVLLNREFPAERPHDPRWDASVPMELYKLVAAASPDEFENIRQQLLSPRYWPPIPSTAKRCGYSIDGVCLSMYSETNCTSGARMMSTCDW